MSALLQLLKKYRKIILALILVFITLYIVQLWRIAHNYFQSFRFGDEDAHMAGGYFILKGYSVYRDFAANHQPLVYYFSSLVQKIFSPNSLYLFIGRHREMIYLYSILWQGLYLWIFGLYMFLFMLIFELCRYVLLGNKLLGETLALYPLVFLFGIIIKKSLFDKQLSIKEVMLFSLSTFVTAFSLLPLWPSLLILNGFFLYLIKKNYKKIFIHLGLLLFFTCLLFIFVPIKEFIQQTIVDNIMYVIPNMNPISSKLEYLKMVLIPFSSFHKNPNLLEIITVCFLILYFFLVVTIKRTKQTIFALCVILSALILTNNRTVELKYGNFHILPWLASYIFIPIVFLNYYFQQKTKKTRKKLSTFIFLFVIAIALWLNLFGSTDYYGNLNFHLKNNLATEHYINYSDSVKYGLGIKAIKKDGDRLLSIPNDTLVFWVANVNLAVRPLESFYWQYELPRYRKELNDLFANNPPEFYINRNTSSLEKTTYGTMILKSLSVKYVRIKHLEKPSDLYVLKTKLPEIKEKQWQEFEYFLFSKP